MANNIVKIWLAKPDTNDPLGHPINLERLKKHRQDFPNDKTILYSNYSDFIQPEKKEELIKICKELNIELLNIHCIKKEIEESNLEDKAIQLALFDCAIAEITNEDGCFAAASDILRTLSPVAKRGIYFDFDDIKLKDIDINKAHLGFLTTVNIDTTTGEFKILPGTNNTPLMCDESKNLFLSTYRKLIFSYYKNINSVESVCRSMVELQTFGKRKNEFNVRMADTVLERVKQKNRKNERLGKINFLPLSIRSVLKDLHNERVLNKEQYETAYKDSVTLCSGPECMGEALKKYLNENFLNLCEKNGFRQHQVADVMRSMAVNLVSPGCHFHQNDMAWVAGENDMVKNYQNYYQNAQSGNNHSNNNANSTPEAPLMFRGPTLMEPLDNKTIKEKLKEHFGVDWGYWKEKNVFWIILPPEKAITLKEKLDSPGEDLEKIIYSCTPNGNNFYIAIEKSVLDPFLKKKCSITVGVI